jgi:hypothetical protein
MRNALPLIGGAFIFVPIKLQVSFFHYLFVMQQMPKENKSYCIGGSSMIA